MSDAPATSSATPTAQPAATPAQPALARTPSQQSDALDARIEAKRAKAEGREPREVLAPPRGADGKFQPSKGAASSNDAKPSDQAPPSGAQAAKDDAAPEGKTDEKKADLEHEKLKAEHEKVTKERDHFKARDAQWTEMAEKVTARLNSQKAYIAQLEAALREKGGDVDPRDVRLMRYEEQEAARKLADERAAAEAEERRQAETEQKRAQDRTALTESAKAALGAHPELREPANQADLVKFLRLVWRGGDPAECAELVSAQIAKRTAAKTTTTVPKTLAGLGGGSGGPKLTDPRDIADKWKARLRTG